MERLPGGRPRTRGVFAFCFLVAAILGPLGAAQALPDQNIVTVGSTYAPGDDSAATLVLVQGQALTYTNLDLSAAHSVTSDDTFNNAPLFDSGVISFRKSTGVVGAASLAPGIYGFHCYVHGSTMHGTITVVAG